MKAVVCQRWTQHWRKWGKIRNFISWCQALVEFRWGIQVESERGFGICQNTLEQVIVLWLITFFRHSLTVKRRRCRKLWLSFSFFQVNQNNFMLLRSGICSEVGFQSLRWTDFGLCFWTLFRQTPTWFCTWLWVRLWSVFRFGVSLWFGLSFK